MLEEENHNLSTEMIMKLRNLAFAVCAFAAASAAYATVTFDGATGTGFVGKGDVQLVLGWNNAALQQNASQLTFSYQVQDKYDATCSWTTTTGSGKVIYHDVTVKKTVKVNDTVQYDARTHKQVDGFMLTGFGTVSQNIDPPVDGGGCLGEGGQQGVWSDVIKTSTSGGLYVTFNGSDYLLPITTTL
jgi:hypothetical protein